MQNKFGCVFLLHVHSAVSVYSSDGDYSSIAQMYVQTRIIILTKEISSLLCNAARHNTVSTGTFSGRGRVRLVRRWRRVSTRVRRLRFRGIGSNLMLGRVGSHLLRRIGGHLLRRVGGHLLRRIGGHQTRLWKTLQ